MKHRRLLTSKQPMAVINKSVDYTEAKRWEIKSGGRDLVNKSIDVCDNEGTFSPVSSKYNRHSMQHSPANVSIAYTLSRITGKLRTVSILRALTPQKGVPRQLIIPCAILG